MTAVPTFSQVGVRRRDSEVPGRADGGARPRAGQRLLTAPAGRFRRRGCHGVEPLVEPSFTNRAVSPILVAKSVKTPTVRRSGAAGAEPEPAGKRPEERAGSEAELDQLLRIALPVLGHLDVQVEVDAGAEQRLDALARVGPDLAEPGAALADDDGLLGRALHVQVDADVEERPVLGPPLTRNDLVDDDGQGVRQLVADAFEGGFPDEFGDHHSLRLVRQVAVRIQRRRRAACG